MSAHDAVARRVHTPRIFERERLTYPLAVLALAAAYYGAAELVFWLEVGGPVAAVVWLPAGVGIAALYLGGNRLWPGVLIGDLLANDYGASPVGTALLQTAGNLAEILIAATLLRRVARQGPPLGSIGGLMGMLVALAAGVTVSATVGTFAQLVGDVIDAGEHRHGLAHVVARRLHGRARARAARHRMVATPAAAAARARPRGRRAGRPAGRAQPRSRPAPTTRCCTSCSPR